MIKKILLALALVVAVALVLSGVGVWLFLANFGVSPQLALRVVVEEQKDAAAVWNAEGPIATSNGVAERGYVRIGGIDQWVTIRGEDRHNPAILILHGGPGDTQSQLAYIYRHWEKFFTVVQWDQRGTGRTYAKNGAATPDMTLDRFVEDGAEVTNYARKRLDQSRIILVAHSWGSIVGVNLIKRHPELFSAYVGTGQVVDGPAQTLWEYNYTLDRLIADGNTSAVAKLRKLGPPPYDADAQEEVMRAYLNRYLVESDKEYLLASVGLALANKAYSMKDYSLHQKAYLSFALPKMYLTESRTNLNLLGYEMRVPFFIVDGREDRLTPPQLTQFYFQEVNAPRKAMIVIDNAGHFVAMSNADAFLRILVEKVRPLSAQRS